MLTNDDIISLPRYLWTVGNTGLIFVSEAEAKEHVKQHNNAMRAWAGGKDE